MVHKVEVIVFRKYNKHENFDTVVAVTFVTFECICHKRIRHTHIHTHTHPLTHKYSHMYTCIYTCKHKNRNVHIYIYT